LFVVECLPASFSQLPAHAPRKQSFTKHLSFDQICEVAAIEREKLFLVEGNQL